MKTRLLKAALLLTLLAAVYDLGMILGNYFEVGVQPKLHKKFGGIVRLVRNDGLTFCTGTVIAPNLILTAAHCTLIEMPLIGLLMNPEPIGIRPKDNTDLGVQAKVIYANQQMDQAVLAGDFYLFEPHALITSPETLTGLKKLNAKFTSCGYPMHGGMYCTEMLYKKTLNFHWGMDGVLLPGMSGGPMMLGDGTVVGVNVAVEGTLDYGTLSVVSPTYNTLEVLKNRNK